MHNGAVKRPGVLVSALLLSLALVTGCSGEPEQSERPEAAAPEPSASGTPTPTPTATATATEKPYLPVPAGVELTTPGSALSLGDKAVVAYRPRQGQVGVLTVAVRRIERTTFRESFAGWKLGDEFTGMTPYFVRATLTNTGDADLGGRPVPLYGVDSKRTLLEASRFRGSFRPCPSLPFPKVFAGGAAHRACLVYLAPVGTTLTSVTFRPSEEFVPITWTGPVTVPGAATPKRGRG